MIIDGEIFEHSAEEMVSLLDVQLRQVNRHSFGKTVTTGDNIMVCCPYPHGDHYDSNPSAGIKTDTGIFHCFACDKVASFPELVSNCFGYNDGGAFGWKWLYKYFTAVAVENRRELKLDMSRTIKPKANKIIISEEELDKYRYFHPYMYKRGLTDEIIDLFDIGYDETTDSITFPVRNLKGDCEFVARRTVKYKRFDIPKNVEKPLYGLYEAYKYAEEHLTLRERYYPISEVYVCEGLFDCLRLWCNNKPAVAGFGCLFSELQVKQLKMLPTRKLVLALDNDVAGRKGAEKLKSLVTNKLIVTVELPKGRKDIGECTDEEIKNLKEIFV